MTQESDVAAVCERLREQGIDVVRVSYPDLIGVDRGRDVLLDELPSAVGHGLATLTPLPWEPNVAWCLADARPRTARRRRSRRLLCLVGVSPAPVRSPHSHKMPGGTAKTDRRHAGTEFLTAWRRRLLRMP